MQINAAYRLKVSEQARLAGMAEATLLLQEVSAMMKAKKTNPLSLGSRWPLGLRTARRF